MLAFLYFVQMLINLPKMLVLSWNNMIFLPNSPPDVHPPRLRITTVIEKVPQLWMTSSDVIPKDAMVNVSMCHLPAKKVSWKLDNTDLEGSNCSRLFRIEAQRNPESHRVTVEILKAHEDLEVISETIGPLKKFWIASIGDSFSSGQGNPDVESDKKWLDDSCYRSTKAFPFQVSRQIPNSALSFLSCSGSTVEQGVLSKHGQIEALESMIAARGAPPDVLLVTIGGNDIGFADVISMVQRNRNIQDKFDMRFFFVSHQIDRVAWKLREMNVSRVVLVDYYDITKNDRGQVDASCGAFGQVSLSNLQLAERKVLQRLNILLRRKAKEHGWVTVETADIFRNRGLCSRRSLIRSRKESMALQGNEYGSFHPNEEAHQMVATKILRTLEDSGILKL